jgi:hypothetical protein
VPGSWNGRYRRWKKGKGGVRLTSRTH